MSQPITSAADYPLPAVERMKFLREAFFDLLYSGTGNLLPAVVEPLQGLADGLHESERLLMDKVRGALVLLANHRWGELGSLPEDELEQDALRDVQRLAGMGRDMADNLQALERLRLPMVAQRTAALGEQRDKLTSALVNQQFRLDDFDARIVEMNAVIKAFDVPGLSKVFKGLIPTPDEIDLMRNALVSGLATPELLKAAATRFMENLSSVVEGRKFSDLLQARSRLSAERNQVAAERLEWTARLASLERELAQLPSVTALDALRREWLEQAQVLSRSWTAQVEEMRRQTRLDELAGRLSAMAQYLLAVRRLYEAL